MQFGRKAAAPATPPAFARSGQPAAPEVTPRTADLATLSSNGPINLRVESRRGHYGFARRQPPAVYLFPTLTVFLPACFQSVLALLSISRAAKQPIRGIKSRFGTTPHTCSNIVLLLSVIERVIMLLTCD
jgi:hypothetical protein